VNKTKVLFITSLFAKMGGAEKNIYDIVGNIHKERFTMYVTCLKGGELIEDLKSKGISASIIGLDKIFSIKAFIKGVELFRFIREEGIQIVVTYHHDADIWGGLVALLARVPVIISSRRDLGTHLQKKHIWAYRILNQLFTKIIAVSDAVKEKVVQREWTSPRKIITIYNGVDIYKFKNPDNTSDIKVLLGISPSKIIIGTLGAIRPIKGHIYLVQAAVEVIKKRDDVIFLIVGYKETEYFNIVFNLIKKLGLEEYFVFTGDRTDISQLLAVIDIYILSSVSEGFSNAVLEAMAAGKPVIASNIGGNAEAVIQNQTGLLVPPRNTEAIVKGILRLLENTSLRQFMGKEGYVRVAKGFTLEKMIENVEAIFERLLREQR